MLDRSSKLDDSLMNAYRSIHEVHKGHAAGDSDIEKQASQLASDIRYKAKAKIKDGMNPEDKKRVYLSLLSSSPAPAIVKSKAKRKLLGESLIDEEGYDHWRDKHLERGGIGAVASKSPSRPYTRSEKQPKGDTAYQKEMKAKHGGKLPSALDVVKSKIEKEHGKGAIMKTEETLSAADKIINNIRSKRVDEGKLVHGPFGPYITGQKMPKEQREVPLRKVPYEDINSAKKAVGEEKEKYDNTKSPDYKKKKAALAKKHGGYDKIKGHPQYEDYHRGTGEKVQARTKKWMDKKGLKGAPGLDAMKARTKEHEERQKASRGVKEEVGVSSSAAMTKARQEAELKSKEEAAVKKAKKAKNEEVALENRMASHTAGMSDAQKDSASNTISKGAAYKMGRRSDAAAFKDRKQSGKRGNPQQYRKSADSPEWEGRFPYGKSNIRQGKGSIKDLKNEYSPAVEKVIESIKINKASPKSPNCIIMPKKDDISDKAGGNGKKSTKSVVTKKQKQFFNQEDTVKTFRQFVTETEYVDEGWGSLVKGAVKSGTSLAKGTAKVGAEVAKKGVKATGDTIKGGIRLGTDAVKHGGDALQKGAETMKKTGSISQGLEKTGVEFSRSRTIANIKRNPNVSNRLVDVAKSPVGTKHSAAKWKKTKAKVKAAGQATKDGLEVAANVKQLYQDQEDKSQSGAGGKVGERQAPT